MAGKLLLLPSHSCVEPQQKRWSYIRHQQVPSSVTIQRRTADQRASSAPVSRHQGGLYDPIVPEILGALAARVATHLTQGGVGFQPKRR